MKISGNLGSLSGRRYIHSYWSIYIYISLCLFVRGAMSLKSTLRDGALAKHHS